MGELRLRPFEGWLTEPRRRALVLRRPATGTELRLEGETARACEAVLRLARKGGSERALRLAAAPELVAALLEHQVLVPSLSKDSGVAILSGGGRLWATRSSATPCPACLRLRLAARMGAAAPPRRLRRALEAELWLELRRAPLDPRQALAVGEGVPASRVIFLEHPDCGRCALPRGPRAISEALRRGPRRPEPLAREALRAAELGPIELATVSGPKGRYPLDQPFAWGSVHLAREWNGRRFSSSTLGGIYSAGPQPRCVEIATSEGVERLAVRGARPDVWTRAAADQRAVPLDTLYSYATDADARARRPFCHALDLIDGAARLVPFESVVVGLPGSALPRALHHQPFYTGAASHLTLRDAVLHATVELLVRDAFMIAWYRRRALPRLSWPAKPSALARGRARFLEQRGLSLELFHLTLDVELPLVLLRLTATRRRGNWPAGGALLVPAGGFTPMAALEHALGLACGQYISIALQPAAFKDPLDPAAVRALGVRLQFWPLLARYLDRKNRGDHAFLSGTELPFSALRRAPATLEAMRARLSRAGLRWLAVRLTDQPAERAGFETVKVIIPGLLDAARSRHQMDLGSARLLRDWPLARPGLHTSPHPLY